MSVIDLANLSLVGGSGIAETKIPIWWEDGTYFYPSSPTSAGTMFVGDGGNSSSSISLSSTHLFALSSTWPVSLQFAFEATIYSGITGTTYAALWDANTNTNVAQVSATVYSATVVRSGSFTLTPGHSYGVSVWEPVNGGPIIVDASLIVFPQ